MNLEIVNAALHRNIKSGKEYNKYFPDAQCRATILGNGDTTYTLELMRDYVEKYSHQTKKIAKVLQANSVEKTVENIYNFLFHHLQYSADGYLQNLRTPACSWASRKLGIDCKSYSLFAGSILKNLRIPFSFRKITQEASPNRWSHVYVTIHYKGSELIIDATKKINTEPNYIKKYDMPVSLPHVGLNADTSEILTQRDSEMLEAIQNFKEYLISLEKDKGVSKETTNAILQAVRSSLQQGIDPIVKESESFLEINGVKFIFNGLGFIDPATATAISSVFSSGIFSNIFGGKNAESEVSKRILTPMSNEIQQKLNAATDANLHIVLTNLDKHLSATINHERKVNSRFSKVAIPKLEKMRDILRDKYSLLKLIQKTSSESFPDFWYGGSKNLAHSGTYTYQVYQRKNSFNVSSITLPTNTTSTTSQASILQDFIQLANGLFQDKKTGAIVTQQQAQQQVQQNNNNNNSNNKKDTSTNTILIATGVGVLVIAGMFLKFKK